MKQSGWLEFRPDKKPEGWDDSIGLVDDDGMPFVMDDFKQFHGKEVLITVEEVTAEVAEREGWKRWEPTKQSKLPEVPR